MPRLSAFPSCIWQELGIYRQLHTSNAGFFCPSNPNLGLIFCSPQELGIYGRLRKISRCGPLSMFR